MNVGFGGGSRILALINYDMDFGLSSYSKS